MTATTLLSLAEYRSGRPAEFRILPMATRHRCSPASRCGGLDVGGDVALGDVSYAYIDGTCQGWLPRGRVLVEVARGYEYQPIREWVDIEPGQRHLQLRLRRVFDPNATGWFSGDTHVHFLSSDAALMDGPAEGLNVVNVLAAQWGHWFSGAGEFTGEPRYSRDGRTAVHLSQENRHHVFGHLGLLGLTKPVYPLSDGGVPEAELGGPLMTTASQWADAAHGVGGTVIVAHLPVPNVEAPALVATGRADALEVITLGTYPYTEYYRYLNAGYRLPLVAGTDKMTNQTPVGLYRTYVYLGNEEFMFENWCAALRAGGTFASSGPLLWLTVDGQQPKSVITLPGPGTVDVTVRAQSIFPIGGLQLVEQGRVVEERRSEPGAHELNLRASIRVTSSTWLAARCGGPNYYDAQRHFDAEFRRGIAAHTSPVFISCRGEYQLRDPESIRHMLTLVNGGLEHIQRRHTPPPATQTQTLHHHGQSDHIAHLKLPLAEAVEALQTRLQSSTA